MMRKITICVLLGLLAAVFACADGSAAVYRVLQDGKWGAITADGTLVIEPEYDYLFPFVNGMTVVRMGDYGKGKRAYLSAEGVLITDFEFDRAYHFFGPLAVVYNDGKQGYIDREGRLVVDISFDYAEDFRGDYALVRNGSWSDGAWGAINSDGTLVVPLDYQGLSHTSDPDTLIFKSADRYGLIDSGGQVIAHAEYDNLYSRGEHLIGVQKTDSLAQFLILDNDGAVLYRPADENLQIRSIVGGFASVYSMGKLGLVDLRGRETIAPRFDGVWIVSEELVITGLGSGRNRRYGLMDVSGRELAPVTFEWISVFNEHELAIILQDSRYGLIDAIGQIVVRPQYDAMRQFSEGYAAVQKGDRWGYIDSTGRVVIDLEFDWVYDFSEGFAVFREGNWEDGKRGYIDKSGAVVIESQFDWAYSFENGIAHVAFGRHYDGAFGYIDTSGSYIWEPSN